MVRPPLTVEDALARKPLVRVVSPATLNVEETVVAPVTESVLPKEVEALEMSPPKRVERPLARSVLEALSGYGDSNWTKRGG